MNEDVSCLFQWPSSVLLLDHPIDKKRIDNWAHRTKEWMDKGIEEVYFFVHPLNTVYSPALTRYVSEQFNKVCNAGLPEVNQLSMF